MATVLIWNNNMLKLRGHTYTGHAAMNITDNWKMDGRGANSYVSVFPSDKAKALSFAVDCTPHTGFFEDLKLEGYAPDHVIHIEGLKEKEMLAEWHRMRWADGGIKYQLVRSNCSSAVARVLKAGGKRGGWAERNNAIWTPVRAKRLAMAMGGVKMTYAALLSKIHSGGHLSNSEFTALKTLRKRCDKHGSSMTDAYIVQGKRVANRDYIESNKFKILGGGRLRPGVTATHMVIDNANDTFRIGTHEYTTEDFEDD